MDPAPPSRPFTVLILGSNLTALALALSLTRKGIAFTLLARSPGDELVPAADTMVPLHPHGVAVLDQLGVWRRLRNDAVILEHGWCNRVFQQLGYPFVLVPQRRLLAVLLAALPQTCVHPDTRAVDIRTDSTGATVITAGMEMFYADFVVDTEGLASMFEVRTGEFVVANGSGWEGGSPGEVQLRTGTGVAVGTAAGSWWVLLRGKGAIQRDAEIRGLWDRRDAAGEVEEGVSRRWWSARTLQLADGAYKLCPALLLSPSLELEAIASLTNAIVSTDHERIFTTFERTFRPRVDACLLVAGFAGRVAVGYSWWHAWLRRWVLPRMPAWCYAELAIRAHVIEGVGLEPRFVETKRRGGIVGRVGDVGLRARRLTGLQQGGAAEAVLGGMVRRAGKAVGRVHRELQRRPGLRIGVGMIGGVAIVVLGVRWKVHVLVGVLLARSLVGAGRRRRY